MYVNAKMIPVETVPGMGGSRRAVEEVNSSVIYLIRCKNFVNATRHPHPAQQ
jgi:acyl CoA:acetate/3-ketoacid CoA transferase beta subunit